MPDIDIAKASVELGGEYARLLNGAVGRIASLFGWTIREAAERLELRHFDGGTRVELYDKRAGIAYFAVGMVTEGTSVALQCEWYPTRIAEEPPTP